jgi:GDP-4-dehydro-6-deoxy-D-mannose reductase
MNVLITGAAGFVGGFLAEHSLQAGCSVLGIDIKEPPEAWSQASFELCDVRDEIRVPELISKFRPDRIFHLAAQSYPTVSLLEPRDTMDKNAGGTINLFESVRASGRKSMIVVACSSAEYGPVAAEDLPVRETHALAPLHPYGVSKVAQDLLAAQYFANYSMPTVRIRIFNTTGPGKLDDVCSDLTKRAVEIELGIGSPALRVGNVTTRRAIVDVRDLVHGLWLAPDHCQAGDVYNVGGNKIYAVQEVIEAIRAQVKVPFDQRQDPDLMRVCDEPVIAGDTTKFRACSNWAPGIDLATTLRDMLNWWRQRLASQAPRMPLTVEQNVS